MKYKCLADNLLIIFCTGMPGVQRVLMFIIVERLYTLIELGNFSSDLSILNVISYFTAIGWSSLVMTKIPKLQDQEEYLFRLITTSVIYYTFFALVLYLISTFELVKDILGSLIFLFSWMLYQILRHFNLTLRAYKKILIVDISCITITISLILTGVAPLISIGVTYLLASILFIPNLFNHRFQFIPLADQIKAGEVGLSNFLLSAAAGGLPFLCGLVIDIKYSALIGFSLSFFYIMHLIPRAISSYFVPKMSKMVVNDKYKFMQVSLKQFTFSSISLLLFSILLIMTIYIIYLYKIPPLINVSDSLYIMYLLLAHSILIVFSQPATDFFLSIEKTKYTLKSSYLYSIITILSASIFLKFGSKSDDIIYLLVMLCFAGFIRNIYLYINVIKHRRNYISNIGKAINEFK